MEALVFLFFLSLSGVFWLLATLNETYEKEFRLPVRLTGVPRDVIITSDTSDTISVVVKDKGFALLAYMSNKMQPVSIAYDAYAGKQRTERGLVPAADLVKLAYQQMFGSTRISSVKPDRWEFYYNHGQSKRVPVRLAGRIEPAKNYYLAGQRVVPEYVTVYASRQMLDSISAVQTADLDITAFDDTVSREVALRPLRGVKMVPSSVRFSLYPDILIEEQVEVPIEAVGMPEGKVLRTFPTRATVRFTVGASMFRNVRAEQFRVVADYREIAARPASKCTLYLRSFPRIVTKCRVVTPQVDYLIEQQ